MKDGSQRNGEGILTSTEIMCIDSLYCIALPLIPFHDRQQRPILPSLRHNFCCRDLDDSFHFRVFIRMP